MTRTNKSEQENKDSMVMDEAVNEEVTAAAVTNADMEDLDTPDTEGADFFMEIPAQAEPAPAASRPARRSRQQAANQDPGVSAILSTSDRPQQLSTVEKAARTAGRLSDWDMEAEDLTTVGIFQTAIKERRILEGVVAGVETNRRGAYWVLYEGPVVVRIPFDNTYMTIPAALAVKRPSPEILLRQRQLLDRAKGAKIHFTISSLVKEDDGNYIAAGSRTNALSIQRQNYFRSDANYPLTVGSDILAQIITNGEHAAFLTFCGMDVKVKKSDLSHKFIQDVSSTFHVGEMIRVRIMTLKYPEKENDLPEITVSAKPIEREMFKRNLKRIQRKGTYIGTVLNTNIKGAFGPQNSVTTTLFLDSVGVPAYSRTTLLDLGSSVKQGDKVSFLAMGVTDEGFAHGKIIEVIKPRF